MQVAVHAPLIVIGFRQAFLVIVCLVKLNNAVDEAVGRVGYIQFVVRLYPQQVVIHLCLFRFLGNVFCVSLQIRKGTVGQGVYKADSLLHGGRIGMMLVTTAYKHQQHSDDIDWQLFHIGRQI